MHISLRLAVLCLCLLAASASAQAQENPQPTPTPTPARIPTEPQKANQRPVGAQAAKPSEPFDKATVAEMAEQCVTLETEQGRILLEMLPEAAPETVRNFLNLAATGMFDTTTFSRIVKGFVVQGGNLTTREKLTMEIVQRARRTIPDEPNYVKHVRGVVSMARSDQPNSATSHFFILVGDAGQLDGKFAAFGRVKEGMSVVEAINNAPTVPNNEKPMNPVRLTRAVVAPCQSKPTKTNQTPKPSGN